MDSEDTTLPSEMQISLQACLETAHTLRRHQAAFTQSSSALAQLLKDWSRRQIVHHFQVNKQMTQEDAESLAETWLIRLAAQPQQGCANTNGGATHMARASDDPADAEDL